jgi:uncharacterized iron-regulated membrane protein
MKEGFRQSMAWLHTWSGLLVGWILFMVFAAGTASYYRDAISLWMKPELHNAAAEKVPHTTAIALAQQAMQRRAPDSPRWYLTLPDERDQTIRAGWTAPPGKGKPKGKGRRGFSSAVFDPATGQEAIAARETLGGDFFFRLHFDLHYMPVIWGRWIIGFCAMFMLVAILSGIVTHRRIFKDFFTFRPGKGQRSWLDFHNVSAVLALPYHLMITYTGLVTLMFMYMPWGVKAVYPEGMETFYADVFKGPAADAKAAGIPATLTPLDAVVAQASAAWGGAPAGRVVVNFPNDANATIAVTRQEGDNISTDLPTLTFDGVTGRMLSKPGQEVSGGATQTRGVMYGLHVARFADPLVRALYFLSGLAGCAMVATGLLLWAVKERPKHLKAGRTGFGLRLVDGLNIAAIAGLPLAMAAFFWANRLLPLELAARPDVEVRCFFLAWAVAAVAALAWPSRPMWRIELTLAGLLFALLPLLNGATGGAYLGSSIAHGLWPVAGFDLVSCVIGLCLLYAAARLARAPVAKRQLVGSGA